MGNIAHAALVLTGAAAFLSVLAWLILSKTPAAPPSTDAPRDAAVETPGAGEVLPPASPAPGETPFDEHVDQAMAVANDRPHGHAWCFPCQAVICVRSAADVVAHLRSHHVDPAEAAHFDAWEREVQSS